MVFSNDDKAVIKKDFVENGWSPYRTAKSKKTKKWYKGSVQRWINQFIKEKAVQDDQDPLEIKKKSKSSSS